MKSKTGMLVVLVGLLMIGCGALKRTAARYWTKKQIEQFIENCETRATPIIGAEKAVNYCDCAVDIVAEEYQNYGDVDKLSIREIIRLAKPCSDAN